MEIYRFLLSFFFLNSGFLLLSGELGLWRCMGFSLKKKKFKKKTLLENVHFALLQKPAFATKAPLLSFKTNKLLLKTGTFWKYSTLNPKP